MNDGIILCVDDDTTVLRALRTLLSQQLGPGHVVMVADSGEEALEIHEELREQGRLLSVVISDYIMPGMRGDELLVRLHALSPNSIKIMLTGQSDTEGVKRAINGANLYRFLEKPFNNDDIVLTARSAFRAWHQDRELERQNAELRHINTDLERIVDSRTAELSARSRELVEKNGELERLAVTDRLTGLYNRLKLDQVLEFEVSRGQRYGSNFGMVLLDVDLFKSVNDTHGHQVGDQVLAAIANILGEHTRDTDVVGRWGGEEFLIIATYSGLVGAQDLAEKLRTLVEAFSFPVVGRKTCSFGATAFRPDDTSASMIGRADAALYRAKQAGRNRVECDV